MTGVTAPRISPRSTSVIQARRRSESPARSSDPHTAMSALASACPLGGAAAYDEVERNDVHHRRLRDHLREPISGDATEWLRSGITRCVRQWNDDHAKRIPRWTLWSGRPQREEPGDRDQRDR